MDIRIIDVPPGEAPEWVRRAWVGLVLPLAPGEYGPRVLAAAGVLTGPRGCAAALAQLLMGRVKWRTGCVSTRSIPSSMGASDDGWFGKACAKPVISLFPNPSRTRN